MAKCFGDEWAGEFSGTDCGSEFAGGAADNFGGFGADGAEFYAGTIYDDAGQHNEPRNDLSGASFNHDASDK